MLRVLPDKKVQPDIIEILAPAMWFLPEAILLTEAASGVGQIIFSNEAFQQLTGFAPEEIKGQDMTFLRGPETAPAVFEELMQSCANAEAAPLELVLHRKDRTAFFDRVTRKKVVAGERAFCIQVHTDISRQKEVEDLLILAQRREAASHLVSGITHDFNNLLTAIMVYTGLMASKTDGDGQLGRYIDEIHAAAQRGAELVTQLLDVERQEAAEPVLLEPGKLVREMHDLMQRVLGEHILLRIEAESGLASIRASQGRLQQVLLNLGINARDAMPNGGDLVIRVASMQLEAGSPDFPDAKAGDYVLLAVTDTGAGMDAQTAASIFKPFFTTKERGKGSGLGLFTVATIVKQLMGHVQVESAPGQGTAFRILLPAESEATPAPRATLLVLEPVDRSLGAILSAKGYQLLFAETVEEALRIANSHPGAIEMLIAGPMNDRPGDRDQIDEIVKARPGIKVVWKHTKELNSRAERVPPGLAVVVSETAVSEILLRKIEELLNQPS